MKSDSYSAGYFEASHQMVLRTDLLSWMHTGAPHPALCCSDISTAATCRQLILWTHDFKYSGWDRQDEEISSDLV